MSRPEPEPSRCVEVLAYQAEEGLAYGSGYRVTSAFVLTAAHLLTSTMPIEVRFGRTTVEVEEIAALDTDLDLALLRLPDEARSALAPLQPVRIGLLPEGSGQVAFRLIGFPAHGNRSAGGGRSRRDPRQVDGTVQLGSGVGKSGWLGLSVTSAPPSESVNNDPWAGISGAGVFAALGGELVGVVSRRLRGAGIGSLDATDIRRIPADSPLRARLLDAGVRWVEAETEPKQRRALNPILSHAAVLGQLSQARRYLVADHLPFVSPGAGQPDEPGALFAQLSDPEARHILLVGGAGGGKTRTCFEVGAIAQSHGWRVYHTLEYSRREITNAHLEGAIFEAGSPALVIVDNLEEFAGLDFGAIHGGLDEEAQRRGVTFRLLATTRPRQAKLLEPAVRGVFERITLRSDGEHTVAVRDAVLKAAAPRAVQRYGLRRLAEYCGRAPAIALLMALDVEQRLDVEDAPLRLPSGHSAGLRGWLMSGLDRDALKPRDPLPDDVLADHVPGPELIAVAAMAAACPQRREDLLLVGREALAELGADPDDALRLLDAHVTRGWLVSERGRIAVVHDQLTDELLRRVLLPDDDAPVYQVAVDAVLDACLVTSGTLGRAALAIRRMIRDLPERDAGTLGPACSGWLSERTESVARALRDRSPFRSGKALAALVGGPPWTEQMLEHWDELAAPWLARHGKHYGAYRPLSLCLRLLPHNLGSPLVGTTLRWLHRYSREPEAGFLIHALLTVPKLGEHDRAQALVYASRWLSLHAASDDAGRLIAFLLRRAKNYPPADAENHANAAKEWLARHGTDIEAMSVLRAALDSSYSELVAEARRRGEAWLARHGSIPSAADILIPILRHTKSWPSVRAYAATWLSLHGTSGRASVVIHALLRRDRILGSMFRAEVVKMAANLLESCDIQGQAKALLSDMLRRDDPDVASRIVAVALVWIEHNATLPFARQLLGVLLRRPGLTEEVRRIGAERALAFVQSQPASIDLDRLLTPLLTAAEPELADYARTASIEFLESFGELASACHVIRALLGAPGLSAEQGTAVLAYTARWLDLHGNGVSAWRVFEPVLNRAAVPDGIRVARAVQALRWVEAYPYTEKASHVLIGLLNCKGLEPQMSDCIRDQGTKWLARNRDSHAHRAMVMALSQAGAREAELAGKAKRVRMSGRRARAARETANQHMKARTARDDRDL